MSTEKTRALWFKAKLYGWGWYPATWQGWAITVIDAALFVAIILIGLGAADNWLDQLFFVWIPLVGLTTLYAAIAYSFGEKPHWQWGKPKSKP